MNKVTKPKSLAIPADWQALFNDRQKWIEYAKSLEPLAQIGQQCLNAKVVGIAGKRYDGVYNLPVGTELIVKPEMK